MSADVTDVRLQLGVGADLNLKKKAFIMRCQIEIKLFSRFSQKPVSEASKAEILIYACVCSEFLLFFTGGLFLSSVCSCGGN